MANMLKSIVIAAILLLGGLGAQPGIAGDQKAVLITGASTGIGRNMAERLAKEGYFVYAGARKDKDLAELDALENIKAVGSRRARCAGEYQGRSAGRHPAG
jgi:NAD(P)-dependent dehydrogenase (short-subunit alcohol dehydrogenase family)